MSRPLPHNKLQVHYGVLKQGETATLWVADQQQGHHLS
jgi:hypothetical protein